MVHTLLFAVGLLLPGTAHAADSVMQEAFRRAIEFVEAYSSYKRIPAVRHWVKVAAGDMARMAMRHEAPGDPRHVVAMFVCSERAMYLSETLDPNDPEQMAVVVHEMVHHAQCEASRFTHDLCPAEREAYRVQAAYHRSLTTRSENGHDVDAADHERTAQMIEATAEAACRAGRNR